MAGKVGPRHSGAQPPPLPSWACPRVFIQPSGANGSQVSLDLPPPGLSSARARVLWYWGPLELCGGGDPSPALPLVLQPSSASVMVGGTWSGVNRTPPRNVGLPTLHTPVRPMVMEEGYRPGRERKTHSGPGWVIQGENAIAAPSLWARNGGHGLDHLADKWEAHLI